MFIYKKKYKLNISIIKRYYKYLSKLEDNDINKFNYSVKNNIDILTPKISNYYFCEKLYLYLYSVLKSDNYKLDYDGLVKFINTFEESNILQYKDLNSVFDIIKYILIEKVSEMIISEKNSVVKYNKKKDKTLLSILESLINIDNVDMERFYVDCSLIEQRLLKFDDYVKSDINSKKIYRRKFTKLKKNIDFLDNINSEFLYLKLFKHQNRFILDVMALFILAIIFYVINLVIDVNYLKMISPIIIVTLWVLFRNFHRGIILKYDVHNNEKMLCLYYVELKDTNTLEKIYSKLEQFSKKNSFDYGVIVECNICDHQIEPFDNEIIEKGLDITTKLNTLYDDRFHFIFRKRNKNFYSNYWHGFDKFNGCLKDIYDLINNRLMIDEKKELFNCYTDHFKQYSHIMLFDDMIEYTNLYNNYGVLLHPYNALSAITYGYNIYGRSFLYNKFIMNNEDIKYAKGTNGLIIKKSYSIHNNNYSIENNYKNILNLLFNKKNIGRYDYFNVILQALSIFFDLYLLLMLYLLPNNNLVIKTILMVIIGLLYRVPVNVYYKIKTIIKMFKKSYRLDGLIIKKNNKCIYLIYILLVILFMILNIL